MSDDLISREAAITAVRPLDWKRDSLPNSAPQRYRAALPGGMGDYSVSGAERQNQWQWFRNGYFVDGHQHHKAMPLELAKAAAQADYDARIRANLTLTPTPVDASPTRNSGDKVAEALAVPEVKALVGAASLAWQGLVGEYGYQTARANFGGLEDTLNALAALEARHD